MTEKTGVESVEESPEDDFKFNGKDIDGSILINMTRNGELEVLCWWEPDDEVVAKYFADILKVIGSDGITPIILQAVKENLSRDPVGTVRILTAWQEKMLEDAQIACIPPSKFMEAIHKPSMR